MAVGAVLAPAIAAAAPGVPAGGPYPLPQDDLSPNIMDIDQVNGRPYEAGVDDFPMVLNDVDSEDRDVAMGGGY